MQQLRALGLTVALLATSTFAHATMVTVEPDDYLPGTDLSRVSSYVTLTNGMHEPVFSADFSCPGYSAPSGSRVFGTSAGGGCHGWSSQKEFALLASFNQEVTDISLSVLNFAYTQQYGATYVLYDAAFQAIGRGTISAPLGQQLNLSFAQAGIRYLQIGGLDSISALAIDHLSFGIPEPGAWGLFALGSLMLVAVGRRRQRARQQ